MPPSPQQLNTIAHREIQRLILSLPEDLARIARHVPLLLQPRPSRAMRRDGIHPDTLGLFIGENHRNAGCDNASPLPQEILLFTRNIWTYAQASLDAYREEVRLTYYHELGHLLGLEEDDLSARGLD